jgi:TRAP-type mannitol/chloroaromatic compound transport system permease small subunit
MKDILGPIAALLHSILPGWVVLPNLTFALPHTMYWLGLLLFPPLAMYLVKRAERTEHPRISAPISYLLWVWGGFAGLHRFYLRSILAGFVYVVLFVLILLGNNIATDARNVSSIFDNQLRVAEFTVAKHQKAVDKGRSGAAEKLEAATAERDAVKLEVDAAHLTLDRWRSFSGGIFALTVALLVVDAFRIPALIRRCEALEPDVPDTAAAEIMERGAKADVRQQISTPLIRLIDQIGGWSGQFVAYWSVLAVFVYYYEVIARYVFNSPTNWAHESMFLMFGMQYLLSGAYAFREGSHVRVDVIYERFSMRTRAMVDIASSVVFFIFTITLIVTGFLFARDAVEVMEVSFTEWAIQYWPVKITFVIGGVLLLLQGIAKLMRDIIYVTREQAA